MLGKRRCAAQPAGVKRQSEGDVVPDLGDGCPTSAWWLSQVSKWWRAWRSTQHFQRSPSQDLQLLGRPADPLCGPSASVLTLLCAILEQAASPGGLCELSHEWRGESLTSCSICFLLQDYIFYLEPDKLESGKGKCSYDPKVDTVSALISESCVSLVPVLPALGRGNVQVGWSSCSHQQQGSCSATPACSSWPGTWPSRGGGCGYRPVPTSRTLWNGPTQWLCVVWWLPARSGAGS